MRIEYLILSFVVIITQFSCIKPVNKKFDKHILNKLKSYKYEMSDITEEEFNLIKEKNENDYNQSFRHAFNLLNFKPKNFEQIQKYYSELENQQKVIYIKNLISSNTVLFKENRKFFLNEIDKIGKENSELAKDYSFELLKLIGEKEDSNSEKIINYLKTKEKYNISIKLLLQNHIRNHITESSTFDLFEYLTQRNDDKYKFVFRLDTQKDQNLPNEIRRKYTNYYLSLLKQEGFNHNDIYVYNYTRLLSPDQVKHLLFFKQSEIILKPELLDKYFKYLGYYHIKYFDINGSLGLIDELPANDKISNYLTLLNLHKDLTSTNKAFIIKSILKDANKYSDEYYSAYIIQILRLCDFQINFKSFKRIFPNIQYDKSTSAQYKSHIKTKFVDYEDLINITNKLKTFRTPLNYKNGELTIFGDYIEEFTLNNSMMLLNLVNQNEVKVSIDAISDYLGPAYDIIINEATKNLVKYFDLKFECTVTRQWEGTSIKSSKVYLKLGDKLHSIIIEGDQQDTKAVYLLLNKALIDEKIKERIFYFDEWPYFVKPQKMKAFLDFSKLSYEFSDFDYF